MDKLYRGLLLGFLLGAAIPLVLIAICYAFFNAKGVKLNDDVLASLLLFGCGLNAYIMLRLFKKDGDYMARGMVLATFVFFIYWVINFA